MSLLVGFSGNVLLKHVSPHVPQASREILAAVRALGAPVGAPELVGGGACCRPTAASSSTTHGTFGFHFMTSTVANSDCTRHEQMVCGNGPYLSGMDK